MIQKILVLVAAGLFLLALFGLTPVGGVNEVEQVALGGLSLAVAALL